MLKRLVLWTLVLPLLALPAGCDPSPKEAKIGVSIAAGPAARWDLEKRVMEEHAQKLGVAIDVRLDRSGGVEAQKKDCLDLLESGVSTLVIMPKDAYALDDVIAFAKKKDVPVISYARLILRTNLDLFVGYDSERIGQRMGKHLVETAYKGNYILLRGDPNDKNATLLYKGAMHYINATKGDINIILDAAVPKWSPEKAKQLVKETLQAHDGNVAAILAPNDKIAEACAQALEELHITRPVAITGMDAELSAVKRILAGKQDMTIYMDFSVLARMAIDEAARLSRNQPPNANAEFDNESGTQLKACLITGDLITAQNIDRLLIEPGVYTKEQVYGKPKGDKIP